MNAPADTSAAAGITSSSAPPTYDPQTVDWDAYHRAEVEWLRAGSDLVNYSIGVDGYYQENPEYASDGRRASSWDKHAEKARAWNASRPRPEQYRTGR